MDESLKHELYFLIAKLLKSEFPSIGDLFIQECENHNMFPSLVFNDHPSFEQLEKTSLPDIPDDQLTRLIQLSCPHSKYPSLFFNASQTPSKPSLATCLSSHILPNVSPMHGMTPQIRVIGHTMSVYCLAFDATNQLLITGSDDNIIKIWDYSANTLMESFHLHSVEITDVQVHPSNEFFAACSLDCSISIISLLDFSVIHTIGFDSEVHIIRFSPDGKYMAVALEEGNVKILNVPTYDEYYTVQSPSKEAISWLSYSPGGEFLIFSADPCDLVIFSMSTFKTEQICHEHTQPPEFVSFSRTSYKQIISCSYKENSIKLWEFDQIASKWIVGPKGDLVLRHPNGHRLKVARASFNCDDSNIVAISASSISCWDTQTKNLINTATNEIFTEHCTALAMHPYIPNVAFVGCASGRASIWDTNLGEVIVPLQDDSDIKITEAIWSNDGLSVVAGDENGGYTKFIYNKQQFITIDQFFLYDFTNDDADHSTICDSQLQPLVPQPKISKISDFHLSIKMPEIRKECLEEEEIIAKRWKMAPFEFINSFIESTSEDSDEGKPKQVKSDSISSLNITEKPITSSRMSTRHSISMYDESLDLDSDPNMSYLFPGSSSSAVFNTRSRAKQRDQIKKLRNSGRIDQLHDISRSSSDDESIGFHRSTKDKKRGNSKEKRNSSPQSSYEYYEEEEDEEEEDIEEEEDVEEEEYEYEYEYEYDSEYTAHSRSESESDSDLDNKVITLSGRRSTTTRSFSPELPKKRVKVFVKHGKGEKNEVHKKDIKNSRSSASNRKNMPEKAKNSPKSTPIKKSSLQSKSAPSSSSKFYNSSEKSYQKKPIASPPSHKTPSKPNRSSPSNNRNDKEKTPKPPIRKKLMDSPVTTLSGRTTTIRREFSPEPAVTRRKTSPPNSNSRHDRKNSSSDRSSSSSKSDERSSKAHRSGESKRRSSDNNLIKISEPKGQKIPSKVPEFIALDRPRIKTYVPQKCDSVVYIRDAHQMHLEECLCFQYPPPFQFMDDFPSVAFCTVSNVTYFVSGLLVEIRINEPKKVKKIVPHSLIYIPYPLAPQVLIERSKYENAITMARSVTMKQEIEVIKTDKVILRGYLVTRDKLWLTNPYQSLTVQIEETKEKYDISPWEILFPMRRMNPTPAQRLCSQIRIFLKSLFENEDYEAFKDWKSYDLEKTFIEKRIRPVDLSLLMRRTTNNYYRTTEELIDDVDRLKKTLLMISSKRKNEIQVIIDSINEAIQHAVERLHIQLSNQK